MWWRLCQIFAQRVVVQRSLGYEEKILRDCAERLVRRKLSLRNKSCETKDVNRNVNRVMQAVLDKYGAYHLVRLEAKGDFLEPQVATIVDQINM